MKRRDRAPRALARGRVIVATTIGLGLARCVELEDPEECVSQRAAVEQLRLNCDCDDPTGDDDDGAASDSGTSASPGHGYGDGDVDADGSTGQDDVGCGCDVAGPPERCAEVAAEYARLRASCKCDEPDPPEPAPACDLDTPVTLYLSPDDSNSMSSPVQAREAILGGGGAPTIRPWEFLNYYRFDYPAAAPGAVTISAELRALDVEGEYYLQIGVGSANVRDSERAPVNLTLVLDESGSMSGHAIEMLKESCVAIASQLRAGDIVSMVTWDTDNAVLLAAHEVSGPYDAALIERVEQIESGGGTDLNGGLTAGYELARAAFHRDRINRVVLVSDGGANVGVTDATLIGEASRDEEAEGIYMVGVGVGGAGYNDYLMDVVTDLGKGASVFIPDEAEAWKIFGERFVNTLDVAVRDVQVQLDLPPGFEIVEFSGEEFSADPTEIEPQHLAPNDAMVFLQRVRTCAPELVTDESAVTVTVRYQDATTFEPRAQTVTWSFGQLIAQASPQLEKGLAIHTYARAFTGEATVADALAQVVAAEQLLPGDEDLAELHAVLLAM